MELSGPGSERKGSLRVAGAALVLGLVGVSCGSGADASAQDQAPVGANGVGDPTYTEAYPTLQLDRSALEPPERVGPPPDHVLEKVDRDAGVTAQLSDGSVVWFFGDTAERNLDNTLAYFEIGSAAWAPASDPTTTQDPPTAGSVQPFATPTEDFPECPPEAPSAGMWPLSAVSTPSPEGDVVLLWMRNICLGSNRAAIDRGISLGTWSYDPDNPPVEQPIVVDVVEQVLFAEDGFGDAAAEHDGLIYVWGCDSLADPQRPDESTPCRVARVGPQRAAQREAYEVWTGTDWVPGATPADVDMAPSDNPPAEPTGPMSVLHHRPSDTWIMAYSPWPAYVPFVALRAADEPQGPWGPPTLLDLPDCEDTYRGESMSCYAANLQPWLTTGDQLGIGYQDKLFSPSPLRGSFMVTSVPFGVTSAG